MPIRKYKKIAAKKDGVKKIESRIEQDKKKGKEQRRESEDTNRSPDN